MHFSVSIGLQGSVDVVSPNLHMKGEAVNTVELTHNTASLIWTRAKTPAISGRKEITATLSR